MSDSDSRITVVSNRLPVTLTWDNDKWEAQKSSGGLARALEMVLKNEQGTWIGWPGTVGTSRSEWQPVLDRFEQVNPYSVEALTLSESEYAGYYRGAANSILWPLFHGLIGRCAFRPEWWDRYRRVNERFAEKVTETASDSDIIWVHDYHLMPLGQYLSEADLDAKVGFFLHIPFPAPENFMALPWRDEVIEGLVGFDLVGFQTDGCVANLRRCLERFDCEINPGDQTPDFEVSGEAGTCLVSSFPIGADVDSFEQTARDLSAQTVQSLRSEIGSEHVLLGVERLDYTKGLVQRLHAYEQLLGEHPQLHGKIKLCQLVVPSRTNVAQYEILKKELDELIGRIQGEYGTAEWQPIRYIYGSVPIEMLTALYRLASVMVVTPVRDGMNLVAKEYCAAQIDDTGALVLSEFAGAADQLDVGAFLVNPYDRVQLAEAMYTALTAESDEKADRMRALRRTVKDGDVKQWANNYLSCLRQSGTRNLVDANQTSRAGQS